MFRKLGFRRSSVLKTWLLSYLTILMLPMVLSIIVYFISSKTLESEIHQANNALLSQVREVMDNYFQSMKRLNFELTWNVKTQELLYSNKYISSPNDYRYDLYQISKDMQQYQIAYNSVDDFYMYIQKDNTLVLPAKVRYGQEGFSLVHGNTSFTYQSWLSIVNQVDFKGFVPMIRTDLNGIQQKTVAYISSYPKRDSPLATNVIMIDQTRILGAIENVELFNKGHVVILNDQGNVLVSNAGDDITANLPRGNMSEAGGLINYTQSNKAYEAIYIKSAQSGLTFISLIPKSLYWQKAELVRNLTIASGLISLLGGLLLTTFFLRRDYNPVRRLVQAFSGKSDVGSGSGRNEFQFLQQAVDNTLLKMDNIVDKMEQQRHILRSNFVVRLLKGRHENHIPIDESLATFHMRFHTGDFAVILLYVEDSEPFYDRLGAMDLSDKRKLLQFIVTNVMEELASGQNCGYVAEVDEALACLINFKQTEEDERQVELQRIAREAQQFLASHYHIVSTLSISGIHAGVPGIAQLYQESLDAMEYKLVMGSKEILSYEELNRQSASETELGYYYPLQVEQQLINCIKVGDYAKAMRTLEEIIDGNFRSTAKSVPYARCLMLNLVSTMIKAVSEIGSVQESFLVQNPKRIERLTACKTIQDMQQEMAEFLKTVCEYTASKRLQNIQQARQQEVNGLIGEVIELISEQYKDPNLNISMIGNHFDMKPTYLSKLFKDQTGEGLLDYINKTRIAKAKHLVAERGKNISDVAVSVGFNDVNAFIRTFKKYEGVTPGKFKEIQAEETDRKFL